MNKKITLVIFFGLIYGSQATAMKTKMATHGKKEIKNIMLETIESRLKKLELELTEMAKNLENTGATEKEINKFYSKLETAQELKKLEKKLYEN